jgi:hypothetical protein
MLDIDAILGVFKCIRRCDGLVLGINDISKLISRVFEYKWCYITTYAT